MDAFGDTWVLPSFSRFSVFLPSELWEEHEEENISLIFPPIPKHTHTHTHTRKKLMSHCSLNTSVFLIMINHLFELSFSTRMNSSVINSMDFRARHLHYFPTRRSWANYWTKSLLQKGDVNTNYPQRVVLRMKWSYACISSIGGCTQ